jgi:hypothetical protein
MADLSDEELLAALGVDSDPAGPTSRSNQEERIVAGFEDIQRFVDQHGRHPQLGEGRDIFERLYATRLERLRSLENCRTILAPLDRQGLLTSTSNPNAVSPTVSDEELLSALGVADADGGLTELRHVRSSAEKRAAEEIAQREKCLDFGKFKALFEQVQKELDSGLRATRPFGIKAEIQPGRFFILGGQKALVADMGEVFRQDYGDNDARLRVIFDNGTESSMLMRSLQRALTKDTASRRITDPSAGPLFASSAEDGDEESGTIYVLRSLSDHPRVVEHRDLLHKVGVTSGSVERRISNAKLDPTFLMADVEIVTTYKLLNINRVKLENLLHRVFERARLDVEIIDRFGHPVTPREWFLVPLFVIDDVVEKIRDGSITEYRYDPAQGKLVRVQ